MYWKPSSWNYWRYYNGNPLWWHSWMQEWNWWKVWWRQDDHCYCYCCSFHDNNLYIPLLDLCKVTQLEKICLFVFWWWEHWPTIKAYWLQWYKRKFTGKIKGVLKRFLHVILFLTFVHLFSEWCIPKAMCWSIGCRRRFHQNKRYDLQ